MKMMTSLVLVLAGILAICPIMARGDSHLIFADGRFSGFDTRDYVHQNHPDLSPDAEAISHWAAYYLVNPMLLTRVVKAQFSGTVPGSEVVRQTALSLSRVRLEHTDSTTTDDKHHTRQISSLALATGLPQRVIAELLDDVAAETSAADLPSAPEASSTPPAFDLPFARPQAWQFNGVHTWTGDDDGTPMTALDFTRTWALRWGDDTTGDRVSAAHDGEVTVYSSCFVQVQHDSGWGTRYYHLDNLQVSNGQVVRAGEPLGIYAGRRNQALCSGGHSTGPHLHFALLKDGNYFGLDDIQLSGYTIHPGNASYDTDHDRMWLEKRGTRYFGFSQPIGTQEGDNTIDYRYNGMWYSPLHNGHGLNVEITEFARQGASRKAVFMVLYTYDDDGQANFYVGNVDYERWRSDESMLIDMLQTAGGDFTNLAAIDFNDPDQVSRAGTALVRFIDCKRAVLEFDLDERVLEQAIQHSVELTRVIGVPEHVCLAASAPLPDPGS